MPHDTLETTPLNHRAEKSAPVRRLVLHFKVTSLLRTWQPQKPRKAVEFFTNLNPLSVEGDLLFAVGELGGGEGN